MHLRGRVNEMQFDLMNWKEKFMKLENQTHGISKEENEKNI